ncbi:MAG: hypothetical protein LUD02_00340 [Tannerellaceae bacterium]|nr:hypothetical protein [Tannerellaceae bacterium]MCD8262782.1 hypothetical protein [Tannerellaceae bacterium]
MKDKIILLFILGLWSTLAAQGEILQWRDNKTFLADSTDVKVIEYDHEQQVDAGPKDSYNVWHNNQRICMQVQGSDTVTALVNSILGVEVFTRRLLPYEQACTPSLIKGVYIVVIRTAGEVFYSKEVIN